MAGLGQQSLGTVAVTWGSIEGNALRTAVGGAELQDVRPVVS
jgi:hypothetical protein